MFYHFTSTWRWLFEGERILWLVSENFLGWVPALILPSWVTLGPAILSLIPQSSSILWNEGEISCIAFLTGVTKHLFRKDIRRACCVQGSLLDLVKQRSFIVWLWRCVFNWKHYETTCHLLFISSNSCRRAKNKTTNRLGEPSQIS